MTAEQEMATWIMVERAALYGVTLAVLIGLACAIIDRLVNR